LAIATLGEIGNVRGIKGDKLVAANEPRSASAEAYRVLRTNISFSSVDNPIKTILITSPSPSEGKSVTAANLAVVMAQAGYNTVLLDCDLRKPSQHKIFNVTNEIGLTNGLLATANAHNFIRQTRVENLRILTSGPLPPNPAELLGSKSMATLIDMLSNESDIIIVDSPPVLAVADAAILSRIADGALMVIDGGHTRREAALRSKEALQTAGARLLGIVLNRVGGGNGYAYNYRYGMPESKNSTGRSSSVTTSTT
jgi:protein-tyrosine kinase